MYADIKLSDFYRHKIKYIALNNGGRKNVFKLSEKISRVISDSSDGRFGNVRSGFSFRNKR